MVAQGDWYFLPVGVQQKEQDPGYKECDLEVYSY